MDGFNYIAKNMSYIRARDPSIPLNYNINKKVRRNLVSQFGSNDNTEELTISNEIEEDTHYQVYLRIKNIDNFEKLYEIKDSVTLLCKVPEGAQCIRNMRENESIVKTFKFSKIIDPQCSQTNLFNTIVKRKMLSFINGHNCTLMSYGASGSGKTFTIVGTAEDPGIIPRSLEYLFRTLPPLSDKPTIKPNIWGGVKYMNEADCLKDKTVREILLNVHHINMDRLHHVQTYKAMQERLSQEPVAMVDDKLASNVSISIWVSFAEIYNENIYDLLKPEPGRGQQRKRLRVGSGNGHTFIKDLTTISVSSGLEAYLILQFGLHNLNYAPTLLNEHSSRSHCIFTMQIVQTSHTNKDVLVSVFNFCDLAGSERSKKTNNAGDRLKESNSINTSLLVLGRCIKLIRDNQKSKDSKLIPFRESKLTQLFQNALLGQEAVSMIVNINPTREMFDETQHVLNFSAIAKSIIVESQSLKSCNNRFSELLQDHELTAFKDNSDLDELQERISMLTDELHQQRLNNEEDRDAVIQTYKKILADTTRHWETRCQDLKDMLVNVLRENMEKENKRAKLSVIILDSSSDEDDKENNDVDDSNEIKLKLEIAELESKVKSSHEQINKAKLENRELEEILSYAKRDCLDLKLKAEGEIRSLKSQIFNNNEQIKELNAYIDFKLKQVNDDFSDTQSYPHVENTGIMVKNDDFSDTQSYTPAENSETALTDEQLADNCQLENHNST